MSTTGDVRNDTPAEKAAQESALLTLIMGTRMPVDGRSRRAIDWVHESEYVEKIIFDPMCTLGFAHAPDTINLKRRNGPHEWRK